MDIDGHKNRQWRHIWTMVSQIKAKTQDEEPLQTWYVSTFFFTTCCPHQFQKLVVTASKSLWTSADKSLRILVAGTTSKTSSSVKPSALGMTPTAEIKWRLWPCQNMPKLAHQNTFWGYEPKIHTPKRFFGRVSRKNLVHVQPFGPRILIFSSRPLNVFP